MKNFEIHNQFLVSVTNREVKQIFVNPSAPTADELVAALKGENQTAIISTADHPAFTQLRTELEAQKYIRIERGWWNGDTVLKAFSLNGHKFKKNDGFPSGSAMSNLIKVGTVNKRSLQMTQMIISAKPRQLQSKWLLE